MVQRGSAWRLHRLGVLAAVGVLLVSAAACSKKSADKPAEQTAPSSTATHSTGTASSGTTKVPTTGTSLPGNPEGQWATSATATSSYNSEPGDAWNASQAIGAPNASENDPTGCGDIQEAWASKERDTVDTLTLGYKTAVVPSEINIVETFNPGAVTKVEVKGPGSQSKTVYEAQPKKITECPRVLTVSVTGVTFPVDSIAITVDQTQVQSWAEIDAVELVGVPGSTS